MSVFFTAHTLLAAERGVFNESVLFLEMPRSPITAAAFTPDGSKVLAARDDGTASLWDGATGKRLKIFAIEKGVWPDSIIFNRNGTLALISDNGYGRVIVLDLPNGKVGLTFKMRANVVKAFSLSLDESMLLTSDNKQVTAWDMQSGKALLNLEESYAYGPAVLGPQEKTILAYSLDIDLSWKFKKHITIWEMQTGKKLHRIDDTYPSSIHSIAWNSTKNELLVAYQDGAIFVRDPQTWQELARYGFPRPHGSGFLVSHDGLKIVSADSEETALWDAKTGQKRKALPHAKWCPPGPRLNTSWISALSSDGDKALIADEYGIAIWRLEYTKNELEELAKNLSSKLGSDQASLVGEAAEKRFRLPWELFRR